MQKIYLKQEIRLLMHLEMVLSHLLKMLKNQTKKVNLNWINRPSNELDHVIKKIRSESVLNVVIDKKNYTE